MTVSELWRYPVKSLDGERLAVAELSGTRPAAVERRAQPDSALSWFGMVW